MGCYHEILVLLSLMSHCLRTEMNGGLSTLTIGLVILSNGKNWVQEGSFNEGNTVIFESELSATIL